MRYSHESGKHEVVTDKKTPKEANNYSRGSFKEDRALPRTRGKMKHRVSSKKSRVGVKDSRRARNREEEDAE